MDCTLVSRVLNRGRQAFLFGAASLIAVAGGDARAATADPGAAAVSASNGAGEMRYGVRRLNTEVLVPISIETGDAKLTSDSFHWLQQLPKGAYPNKPLEIALHPAQVEDGVIGSRGVNREARVDKTREALQTAFGGPLLSYSVREAPDSIFAYGDKYSVSRVRMDLNVDFTLGKVLYLTDRGPHYDSAGKVASYDNAERGKLSYGLAVVQIEKHLDKPASGPWDWVTRFFKGDPTPPSAEKLSVSPIADAAGFSSAVAQNLQECREDQVLVYIHGFNTTFDQTVQDATLLGYLTKFPGPVIVYSWPSEGSLSGYDYDYEVATRTIPRFQAFLRSLRRIPHLKRIDLVAHSMGSRILFWALKGDPALRINEVVMVAGDVAQEDFRQYFRDVQGEAGRFTVYSTHTDYALYFSSVAHKEARIGFSADSSGPFTLPGIDAIDATTVVQDLISHGYHLNSELPRTDIIYALRSEPITNRGCLEWNNSATKDFLRYTCH